MVHRISVIVGILAVGAAACAPPVAEPEGRATTESRATGCQGEVVSEGRLASLLRQGGFPETAVGTAVCIARKESTFCSTATSPSGKHHGLFQISEAHFGKGDCPSSLSAVEDPAGNVACAKMLFDGRGGSWGDWAQTVGGCEGAAAPPSDDGASGTPADPSGTPADANQPVPPQGQPLPPDDLPPWISEDEIYFGPDCPYREGCWRPKGSSF